MSNEVAVKSPEKVEVVERQAPKRVYRPLVNVSEKNDAVTLSVEMPGVAADTVDITVEKRRLTIRGDIRRELPEGYEAVYNELRTGSYERTFSLNNVIDVEGIGAAYENGLLTLTLPKVPKPEPRKITIQTV